MASWRHPRARIGAHVNIADYAESAQTAERAKFGLPFLADGDGVRDADDLFRGVAFTAHFVLLSRLQNAPNSLNKPDHFQGALQIQ